MMTAIPKVKLTVEEYLAGEQVSEIRHEYLDGEVYAIAGASRTHGAIVNALAFALTPASREKKCQLYTSDMKVRIELSGKTVFYYPDLVVGCDPKDRETYYLTRPSLIIEVSSPSTERIDHREKLLSYIRIESLVEYLIVESERRAVEIYRRNNDWLVESFEEDGAIRLDSLECTLTLDEIYADLALLPPAA